MRGRDDGMHGEVHYIWGLADSMRSCQFLPQH